MSGMEIFEDGDSLEKRLSEAEDRIRLLEMTVNRLIRIVAMESSFSRKALVSLLASWEEELEKIANENINIH